MNGISRATPLLIVLILSCGFLSILGTVRAESAIPKPEIPEFTVKLVDRSYDVAPTQITDPYTGKTENRPGYHVKKTGIDITIKNQDYPYPLSYSVRTKGHFEDEEHWVNMFTRIGGRPEGQYTVLEYEEHSYPDGAKVDFQVEALYGSMEWNDDGYVPGVGGSWHFVGERSGWSKTQTLTVNSGGNGI
ncbi:MAG: hypothetical protein LBE76_08335, partial [Nitrososphaerota archaeon]|nr:hypothetical protein [Nitrososphaerota archaeon]